MFEVSEEGPAADAVVIGAGISGLCAAYWLKKRGVKVTVLEKESEAGGTMKTRRENGWLAETGPNSALETTPLFGELFDELGILPRQIHPSGTASRRYILRNGKLHALPAGPISFLTCSLWSPQGKLRLLAEPLIGRGREEESVAEFVRRRLGKEFLDYTVDPFVGGVYAGDPEKLSMESAFPRMFALESKHGGLFKGMLALGKLSPGKTGFKGSKLFSFLGGMQELPAALASALGDSLVLNAAVEHIIPMRAGRYPVYTVAYRRQGASARLQARAVVLASPAASTAQVIRPIDPEMAHSLESIYYPPVAVAYAGFRRGNIGRPLDGFGFLVPQAERRRILGTIWSSALFPNRAPDGNAALTTFLGGARSPELAAENDDTIRQIVLGELRSIMNIDGEPVYWSVNRWERAIPQYNMGYRRVLQSIDRFEQNFRGAFICSNYRGGISVGDCVTSAGQISARVADHLSA